MLRTIINAITSHGISVTVLPHSITVTVPARSITATIPPRSDTATIPLRSITTTIPRRSITAAIPPHYKTILKITLLRQNNTASEFQVSICYYDPREFRLLRSKN